MLDVESIRTAYPAAPHEERPREQARRALVRHIERRSRRVVPSRRLALAGAGLAAAAAAVAIGLVGIGDRESMDASAAALLRDAATKVKAQKPLPPIAERRVLYVKSVAGYMATWADRGNFSVFEPHVREIWQGPEGGRLVETGGPPRFLGERDRKRWIAAGRPKLTGWRSGTTPLPAQEPSTLPTDPDDLFSAIEEEARGHSEGTNRQMFTRVADYLRETNIRPAHRAALYEVAARIPGVEYVGPTRDSAGRRGVAVAMENPEDGIRHTLVIDPRTGTLLAEQQVTLADNYYGYPEGTVVGHSTYLVTAMVEAVGSRPG
jgi:hypothetical protein